MDYGIWQFSRGAERLQITRQPLDDGTALIVGNGAAPRSYFFSDPARLETFQNDMETLLLKTGWCFLSFAPDQRAGQDRRGFPRRANDRRRWWTDGIDQIRPGGRSVSVRSLDREGDKQRPADNRPPR
jgi:hypothetical protein